MSKGSGTNRSQGVNTKDDKFYNVFKTSYNFVANNSYKFPQEDKDKLFSISSKLTSMDFTDKDMVELYNIMSRNSYLLNEEESDKAIEEMEKIRKYLKK